MFICYILPQCHEILARAYLTFLNVLIYSFGLCSMVYVLNMKLIKMILVASDKSKLNLFNQVSAKFMSTITKLSVLQGIFTCSAILYVIISIIHNVVFYNFWSYLMDWIFYTLTIITGTACMYLTFTVNSKEYSVICRSCNNLCKSCCNSAVKSLYRSEIMIAEMNQMKRATMTIRTHSSKTRTDEREVTSTTTIRHHNRLSTTIASTLTSTKLAIGPPTEDTIITNMDSSIAKRQSTLSITAVSVVNTNGLSLNENVSLGVDGKMDANHKPNLEISQMEVIGESELELDVDSDLELQSDHEEVHPDKIAEDGLMPLEHPSIGYITPQVSLENNL